MKSGKLGCGYCSKAKNHKVKTLIILLQWKNYDIQAVSKNKSVEQVSLQKKMQEQFASKTHILSKKQIKTLESDAIAKWVDGLNSKFCASTCKIFNTVYGLVKKCKPFSDVETVIEIQIKNDVDMGSGLHSRTTATSMADHIANKIKTKVFKTIIEKKL